jgi:membrane associated rhomboid family serine protease
MTYTTTSHWGSEFTPKAILSLIIFTTIATLVSALSQPLFTSVLELPGLQEWLSLSWWGVHHYLLWQPISYLFIQPLEGGGGIGIYFLLSLLFNMYLLWMMGSSVQQTVGTSPFLRLYLLSGVAAALGALFAMNASMQYPVIAGPLPAILAVLTVWTMLNPSLELLLFFVLPVKAKWLWLGIVGSILLVNLSNGNWVYLALYLTPILFGYFYALLAWGFQGPFEWSHGFDYTFAKMGAAVRKGGLKARKMGQKVGEKTRIFDIKTGESILDDDLFIDAMLAKISRNGEGSLTYRERHRMKDISERKTKRR